MMEEKEVQYPTVNFDEFSIPTYDEWKVEVEKALKGGIFEKKMFTPTYEGITLEPIYTLERSRAEKAKGAFPGMSEFLRGSKVSGYIAEAWGISQKCDATLPKECNELLKFEISKGTTVYNISLDEATKHNVDATNAEILGEGGVSVTTLQDMSDLIEGLDFEKYPVYLLTGASSLSILALLVAAVKANGGKPEVLKGTVGADPVGTLARYGKNYGSLDALLDEMAHVMTFAKTMTPKLRTIVVSGDVYANGGASDVEELAYMLSTAIFYVRGMQRRGFAISDITKQMSFEVSIGANFFMEIAKLRVLRALWSFVVESFGGDEEAQHMYVHGKTAAFTKTVYDPYVNMLRDTTQAFSGVVGGLDSLEISCFDAPIRKGDVFSRRIARNMQVMMQDEFELRQPVDPEGGSWYIETLAQQLQEKVWTLVQEVENEGGIIEGLKSGKVQASVDAILQKRFKALEVRSDVAVGNNMYPNMTEVLLEPRTEDQDELHRIRLSDVQNYVKDRDAKAYFDEIKALFKSAGDAGALFEAIRNAYLSGATIGTIREALSAMDVESEEVTAITPHRWTERFEELRMRTEAYKAKTGDNVKVFLANMGKIPQHKPRADFSTGFMEVAAFEVLKNDGFPTTDEAAQAAADSKADVVVICSTDATYPELVPPLAKRVKELMPGVKLFLAGAPAKDMVDTYLESGVDDFVHVKANCYQILTDLQARKGMM